MKRPNYLWLDHNGTALKTETIPSSNLVEQLRKKFSSFFVLYFRNVYWILIRGKLTAMMKHWARDQKIRSPRNEAQCWVLPGRWGEMVTGGETKHNWREYRACHSSRLATERFRASITGWEITEYSWRESHSVTVSLDSSELLFTFVAATATGRDPVRRDRSLSAVIVIFIS